MGKRILSHGMANASSLSFLARLPVEKRAGVAKEIMEKKRSPDCPDEPEPVLEAAIHVMSGEKIPKGIYSAAVLKKGKKIAADLMQEGQSR